jgi:co-chaperonin GroES (HSP10)
MIIPLQNFLVIEQEANEEKLVGSIWIPQEKNPAKQFEGIIVSVGPDVKNPDLKPGTIIALNAWGQVVRRKEKRIVDGV